MRRNRNPFEQQRIDRMRSMFDVLQARMRSSDDEMAWQALRRQAASFAYQVRAIAANEGEDK